MTKNCEMCGIAFEMLPSHPGRRTCGRSCGAKLTWVSAPHRRPAMVAAASERRRALVRDPGGRPTRDEICALLDYDPERGIFRWKLRRHKRGAGAVAGHLDSLGYRRIAIVGRYYRAAILAWVIMTGEWPVSQVDHHDTYGPKADWGDRWENLRLASPAENTRNGRRRRNNTSGVTGVFWSSQQGKWQARIYTGASIHLGFFDDLNAAATARRAAELRYFGEFAPSPSAGEPRL